MSKRTLDLQEVAAAVGGTYVGADISYKDMSPADLSSYVAVYKSKNRKEFLVKVGKKLWFLISPDEVKPALRTAITAVDQKDQVKYKNVPEWLVHEIARLVSRTYGKDPAIMKASDKLAFDIASNIKSASNELAAYHPYKDQYLLEEVITKLQSMV